MSRKSKSVDIRVNPLYPDRIESNAVGVLIAVVSMVVAILCLGLIVMNFSYAVNPEKVPGYMISDSDDSDSYDGNTYDDTDDGAYEEEIAADQTGETAYEDTDDESQNTTEEISDDTTTAETGDYIIADSASRYLTRDDLVGMSAEELRLARNEIYARHGRMFDDETLQAYFNSKSWYSGTIAPDNFSEDMLNDYEKQNTYTITDYEKEMGYR